MRRGLYLCLVWRVKFPSSAGARFVFVQLLPLLYPLTYLHTKPSLRSAIIMTGSRDCSNSLLVGMSCPMGCFSNPTFNTAKTHVPSGSRPLKGFFVFPFVSGDIYYSSGSSIYTAVLRPIIYNFCSDGIR